MKLKARESEVFSVLYSERKEVQEKDFASLGSVAREWMVLS